eukprot:3984169-Prymnesium_polylepis.1
MVRNSPLKSVVAVIVLALLIDKFAPKVGTLLELVFRILSGPTQESHSSQLGSDAGSELSEIWAENSSTNSSHGLWSNVSMQHDGRRLASASAARTSRDDGDDQQLSDENAEIHLEADLMELTGFNWLDALYHFFEFVGAAATGAVTTGAVIQEIKPEEFEASQKKEQRRKEQERQKRQDEAIARMKAVEDWQQTMTTKIPWRSIGSLAAIIGVLVGGWLLVLTITKPRPPPAMPPPLPPLLPPSPPVPPAPLPPPPSLPLPYAPPLRPPPSPLRPPTLPPYSPGYHTPPCSPPTSPSPPGPPTPLPPSPAVPPPEVPNPSPLPRLPPTLPPSPPLPPPPLPLPPAAPAP